jgi:MFS family permease
MGLVWAGFSAQVPVLKAQIGASDATFGMIFLVASIGALFAVWLAPLVDSWMRSWSIALASLALCASLLIPALATSVFWFAGGLLLASAASGVSDIVINARVAEVEAARQRPMMNLVHAVYSFSYAGTALITGILREAGYSPVYIFGLIAVAICLIAPLMRARPATYNTRALPEPGPDGARALVWLAGLVVLVGFMAEQAVDGWSALHLERTLGGDPSDGAMGPAILGLTMGFGRLFGQVIAHRVTDTVMIAGACLMSALGVSLAALADGLALAYLGFAIMGLGVSVVVPLTMALVGRAVPQKERIAAIGRASVIGYGAFLVGPSLMGLSADLFGLRTAFLLVALMLVTVAFPLMPMIARQVMRKPA